MGKKRSKEKHKESTRISVCFLLFSLDKQMPLCYNINKPEDRQYERSCRI